MSDITGRRPSSRHFKQRWRDSQRFKKFSDSEVSKALNPDTKEKLEKKSQDQGKENPSKNKKTPSGISQDTLLQEYLDYTTDLALEACSQSKTIETIFAKTATEATQFEHRKLHHQLHSEKLVPKVRKLLGISKEESQRRKEKQERLSKKDRVLSNADIESRKILLDSKKAIQMKIKKRKSADIEELDSRAKALLKVPNAIEKLKDLRQAHIEDSLETQIALTPEIAASLAKEIAKERQNSIKPASKKRAS